MPKGSNGDEDFDERRFVALFRMAGPEGARELADRLDKDLTMISQALSSVQLRPDHQVLSAQRHMLMAIAGTIGANQLYRLSERLNGISRAPEGAELAEFLVEIQRLLTFLIHRVRSLPSDLVARP